MRLANKVILVTGAAHGLGAATADLLLREGARVVAVDRDAAALNDATRAQDASFRTIVADVTCQEQMRDLMTTIHDEYGGLDGVAHYAGITRDGLATRMPLAEFEEVLRVNLTGSFIVAQAAANVMIKQSKGSILLTASRVYLGNFGQANYAASKGGVVSLCRTMALELARYGVRVNALAPGFIDTPMTRRVPEKARQRALTAIPLGRAGMPEEVARAALFLLSDEASYVTGQVLFVDGGRTTGLAPS